MGLGQRSVRRLWSAPAQGRSACFEIGEHRGADVDGFIRRHDGFGLF